MFQGDGAPPDIHPHFLYLSKTIKDNPDQFHLITDTLEDICKIVCEVLQKHLPHTFDQLQVFCEILPLNHHPATYPFPGFILNI